MRVSRPLTSDSTPVWVIIELITEKLDDGTEDKYIGDVLGPFTSYQDADRFAARRGSPGLSIESEIRQVF